MWRSGNGHCEYEYVQISSVLSQSGRPISIDRQGLRIILLSIQRDLDLDLDLVLDRGLVIENGL